MIKLKDLSKATIEELTSLAVGTYRTVQYDTLDAIYAEANRRDARRTAWPTGKEAAEQLAAAFNDVGAEMIYDGKLPDALRFDKIQESQRRYALERAAAVLARLQPEGGGDG